METINRFEEICKQAPKLPKNARIIQLKRNAWDVELDEIGRMTMYVPIKKIKAASVQRPKDEGFVDKIASNFIAQMFRNPVGFYKSPNFHIVDCNHSVSALRKISPDVLVPCVVINEECAHHKFVLLNSEVRKVSLNDKFMADLKGKEPLALFMHEWLTSNGITYGLKGRRAADKHTVIPGSMYKRLQKFGPLWKPVMEHLVAIYNGEPTSMEDTFQNGFFTFCITSWGKGRLINWNKIRENTAYYTQRRGAAINAELRANSGGLKDGIFRALLEQDGR